MEVATAAGARAVILIFIEAGVVSLFFVAAQDGEADPVEVVPFVGVDNVDLLGGFLCLLHCGILSCRALHLYGGCGSYRERPILGRSFFVFLGCWRRLSIAPWELVFPVLYVCSIPCLADIVKHFSSYFMAVSKLVRNSFLLSASP